MNYELAKELKDAGFSQECEKGDQYYFGQTGKLYFNGEGCYGGDSWIDKNTDVKCPSLFDLIKAFGNDFNFVCQHPKTHLWGAETHSGSVIGSKDGFSASEEAVARLWLAVNKK